MNGLTLTFHLAGINNQNFLMRDDQTGTYWQQISGRAISGPLAGQALKLIPSDELTFALWKSEQPDGIVLKDLPADAANYAPKGWEVILNKAYPTILSYPEHGLASRDLVLGIEAFGEARAFPYEQVIQEKLVQDRVGSEPVILLVGADDQSVRAFRESIPGSVSNATSNNDTPLEFFRTLEGRSPTSLMMDSATGSRWNFKGCAVEGKLKGACLERLDVLKDYWFNCKRQSKPIYEPRRSDVELEG